MVQVSGFGLTSSVWVGSTIGWLGFWAIIPGCRSDSWSPLCGRGCCGSWFWGGRYCSDWFCCRLRKICFAFALAFLRLFLFPFLGLALNGRALFACPLSVGSYTVSVTFCGAPRMGFCGCPCCVDCPPDDSSRIEKDAYFVFVVSVGS